MHALIIGATGATGRALLDTLLNNSAFGRVSIFVRRPVAVEHPKLAVHVIDFAQTRTWQDKVRGDALFSCLGTTLKDAGSKEAQWQIDYDYPYRFAQTAQANGVPQLLLVSSAYANPASKGFYTRMKGRLEQDITALGFASLGIFRPPSLVRPNTDRTGEKTALWILNRLNRIGLLHAMQPMPVAELAQALAAAAKQAVPGVRILETQEIRAAADTR
ncbi:NAD(P)H-binding protein [Neisseria musculi]|uniref:NADH(P)-binding family protein n=1 Tax=Neisseria musculi TaxID=1815583 RepID=A0A7H1MF82_9NEIS|nr:NAD(P)H-binding protein [Neisseria musculi]QNT60297.1 NADH(P)-binding family protein [Neisseria musculi]